jgi:hypothetical protein
MLLFGDYGSMCFGIALELHDVCPSLLQPVYSVDQKWSMNFAKNFDNDDDDDGIRDSGEDVRTRQTIMVR